MQRESRVILHGTPIPCSTLESTDVSLENYLKSMIIPIKFSQDVVQDNDFGTTVGPGTNAFYKYTQPDDQISKLGQIL